MSQVFGLLNYREILTERANFYKKTQPGWTLQRLAERSSLHPPYLTNVLKRRVHLNADQLYIVTENLGFNSDETHYCLLLLDLEKSTHPARQVELRKSIDAIRAKKLTTDQHLRAEKITVSTDELARFYLNPELQLIHAFMGVARFAKNLDLIASSLNITPERVRAHVAELIELGFVKATDDGYVKLNTQIHLLKDSALCVPQQILMQERARQHLNALAPEEKYNFAVTFTANAETREKIHREFLAYLSRIEQWVKDAPSEEVYQMQFSLFHWSR